MSPIPSPSHEGSLAGRLLVASPALLDPNFRQGLIYLAEHHAEGALGMVINRPSGATLGEVSQGPGLDGVLAQVPVYLGGPVRPEHILLAVFSRGVEENQILCSMDRPAEEVVAVLEQPVEGIWVRAFAGHSGWSAGQLEAELADKAWVLRNAHPVLFNETMLPGLWPLLVRDDERWRDLLPFLPEHPSRN